MGLDQPLADGKSESRARHSGRANTILKAVLKNAMLQEEVRKPVRRHPTTFIAYRNRHEYAVVHGGHTNGR